MVARIGDDFDDGPQSCVGADGKANISRAAGRSSRGEIAGATVGEKSDDEENCEEESSNHEHHGTKSRTTARRGGGSSSAMLARRVSFRALALRVLDRAAEFALWVERGAADGLNSAVSLFFGRQHPPEFK